MPGSPPDDLHRALREVLEAAPAEWPAVLDRICSGRPELRRELDSILASRNDLPRILETHAIEEILPMLTGGGTGEPGLATSAAVVPAEIGPYRILGVLGEGGMGTVYLAEQTEPLHRRVALKVVKVGMDTRSVIARFEAERQALARMDHRSIATVLDAGATESGRPYFVMEYVDGVSITEYCDRHGLSTEQRVSLLVSVSLAIHHAHQRGILHRDIKPSNVLVTEEDGIPQPKIIDFGVAKALDRSLSMETYLTEQGVWIGTPEYMSPEQARGDNAGVDTTTDVYSLGVLLYELLTGSLPFERREGHALGLEELRRRIAEEEPVLPSRRILETAALRADVAGRRRTTVNALVRQVRGDLDWITARAMEKERLRRYASASELASDLGRSLRHEAIVARPPSAVYVLRKFVRRHRVVVGVSSAIALALVGGAALATWGMMRARSAEADARLDAATASHVSTFLEELFEVSDPGEARGNTITAREILDRGAERIHEGLQDEPEVQSRLMGTIGRVYRKLGLFDPALPLLEGAVEYRRPRPREAETRAALNDLAAVYLDLARYDEAESTLERATTNVDLTGDDPDLATSLVLLGSLATQRGDFETADARYEEALEMRTRLRGGDDPSVTDVRERLGSLRLAEGRFQEAIPPLEAVVASRRARHRGGHPDVAAAMDDLATAYEEVGRSDEAERIYREALDMRRRILGEDHPQTADNWNSLAVLLNGAGRYAESEEAHRKALAGRRAAYGDDHPDVAQSLSNLASTIRKRGDDEQGEALMREALAMRIRILGPFHPDVANTENNLAQLLQAKGEFAEADTLFAHAAVALRESMGPDSPYLAIVLNGLGTTRHLAGHPDLAEAPLARAVEILREALPEGHPRLAIAHWRLGACLHDLGRPEDAEPHLEAAYAVEEMPVDRLEDLVTRLAAIHESRGDAERAGRYRERLREATHAGE